VTVLFADLAGSTAIAERLGPDEFHLAMDRCFALLLDEVHRYEGTVNQFTGDGIMAIFGAPLALEDAPRRAVLAALGMQRALAGLREELAAAHGIDLRMRIGIHSGLVVVGRIGNDLRMDYTAVGDTTHLASRLQSAAAPGSVLVSETTARGVERFFALRDVGPLELKGVSRARRVFEVEGVREDESAARPELALTPLAGRERELALLREAFESARQGRGRVVLLVGEAGLGKSRLLYEFRRRLGGEPHLFGEGRCASFGSNTAFLPIVDALRRLFEIDDRDDEATAIAKIEAWIVPAGDELAWTLPFLRALLSLPAGDESVEALDPATRRSETFRALKALVLTASARRPFVIAIEDLHWIDPASEECVAFLAESVAAARVLMICSYRPGTRLPFGDRSYHVRVSLDRLSEAETAALTCGVLGAGEVPESVRRVVAGKAEGNPLFLEEVARSLLEDGTLRRENGRVVLARDLADVAVPDRIHDVLMARIDRLAEEPKRAIQIAAVIGREFVLRLLERIQEVGEKASALVEDLRAVELVYEKAVHPELAYMFKHALTHEVAYASVLVQRRKQLHHAIGLAIETLYADRLTEHYETLAHHFERAEDWPRALDYHERSAEKAALRYASRGVVWHCQQALAIAARLGSAVSGARRRALEQQQGLAFMYLSEFAQAGDAFARAAEHAPDVAGRSIDLANASHCYVWAHAPEPAERTGVAALELARSSGDAGAEALARGIRGFADAVVGRIGGYREQLREAQRLAAASGDEGVGGLVHFMLAELGEWTADYAAALEHGERALAIGRKLRLAHLVVWANWFMGKASCCRGDYGRALHLLREGLGVTQRIGDRAWSSRLMNTLGWVHAEVGDPVRALAYNQDAAQLASELGDAEIIANAAINLAGNHLSLGRLELAETALDPVLSAPTPAYPFMRWRYTMHLEDAQGRLALAHGRPEQALLHAERELGAARRHSAGKLEVRALDLRARALAAQERRDEALQAVTQQVALAERIGYARAHWVGLGLAGELERRGGRSSRAEAHAAQRARVLDGLARSLSDSDLRQSLLAVAAAPALP
jgi:class 3 adenylate cyclase/tetratricopeptide (TPR) repeat protein